MHVQSKPQPMLKLLTLSLISAFALAAQDKEVKKTVEVRPVNRVAERLAPQDTPTQNLPSLTAIETFTSINVAAQDHASFIFKSDFTGAERASVSLLCASTTSLKSVGMVMYWTSSIADFWAVGGVILGGDLLFNNGGGAVVPVYGTRLQIDFVNTGTTPISCNQLMVYAVVH